MYRACVLFKLFARIIQRIEFVFFAGIYEWNFSYVCTNMRENNLVKICCSFFLNMIVVNDFGWQNNKTNILTNASKKHVFSCVFLCSFQIVLIIQLQYFVQLLSNQHLRYNSQPFAFIFIFGHIISIHNYLIF